jgi:hypothetical protein
MRLAILSLFLITAPLLGEMQAASAQHLRRPYSFVNPVGTGGALFL